MKFSIIAQIQEVEREIKQREQVYPRLVATRAMRQSIADYQMDRMKAVLATLRWLEENEPTIKHRLSQ